MLMNSAMDSTSSNNYETVSLEIDDERVEDRYQDLEVGDGCLPPPSPIRAYFRSASPYISGQGVMRYNNALKSLIPVRRKVKKKDCIGVDDAGFFSFVCYSWVSKFMYKAHRKGLHLNDIPQGSRLDSCDYNGQRLEKFWLAEVAECGPTEASLKRVVWRFVRTRILAVWLAYTGSVILGFLTPVIFMRNLLEYAQDPNADIMTGVTWALCLTISELLRTIMFSWHWAMTYRTAVRLRSACLGLLYRKIIRMNNLGEKSIGELINIFGNDAQRIFDMMLFGPMIIGGPLVIICGVGYIFWLLGPWALFGIMVYIIFYPTQYMLSRWIGVLRGKTVVVSDQRVSLMSEILNSIKLIKMYAWEDSFVKQIHDIRDKEHAFLQKSTYLSSLSISMAPTIPIISAIVTFLSHLSAGNTLTAAQAFPFIAFLNSQVRNSLNITQYALQVVVEAMVGLRRIKHLLLLEEMAVHIRRPIDRKQAVSIGGAKFAWDIHHTSPILPVKVGNENLRKKLKSDVESAEKEHLNPELNMRKFHSTLDVLFDINFNASKGHLVGVCGPVGSGKSALLLAIMGQLRLLCGQVARDGTCAYVSQQAWITNGTFRENILFGEVFDNRKYYLVIHSCALNEDLNQLPGGDQTEIGERGINLSGGQRQRVALARALYAKKDIYLLDDPLSAVDANVGAHIFDNYILKELKDKTVVLVTHQIQYLSRCNEVYMMKDGHIIERGTHEQLMVMETEYSSMVNTLLQDTPTAQPNAVTDASNMNGGESSLSNPRKDSTTDSKITSQESAVCSRGDKLTVEEAVCTGSLKTDTYCSYISAAGGYFITSIVVVIFLINVGSSAFSSWWLAMWINAGGGNATVEINNQTVPSTNLSDNPDFDYYRNIYASTIALILGTSMMRCLIFTKSTLRASTTLHNRLFDKLMHSPMLFFESNPIGRLQNLCSRDMDEVDTRLPPNIENILQNVWIVAFALLFICIVFPLFFGFLIPLAFIYYCISRIFRKAIRDLKRIDNSTRSPVFSCLTETVQGLSTIHAFNKEADLISKFFAMYDENSTCNYLWNVAMRWLAVRIDTLAVVVMSFTAVLVILLHGVVPPAMAGLALAYSWHISGVFQFTIRLISETEVRFISVERIQTYIESIKGEGKETTSRPSPTWPKEGEIRFQNVCLRYREGQPNALENVTFTVLPREKIGVVGRTGSGKSSLMTALFRLVELNVGRIRIDGVDISDIPLHTLRSKLSIIPQDPVLFIGTLRSNLDPGCDCNDTQIWEALVKTKLSDRLSAMPLKLGTLVGTGGECLSMGERQLLCLTRALLRNSQILVLDEATSSVDPETEAAVQTIIQQEFAQCTVLTIAHRLSTVSDCHRILVMDKGRVAEFDSPSKLMENSNSLYSKMVATAEASVKMLKEQEDV